MASLVAKGQLLVANPGIYEPNFHRTLVFVLEHEEAGALGVVLNRPSETPVGSVLPEWSMVASPPDVLFVGGPVNENAIIGIAEAATDPVAESEGWAPLWGGLATVDLQIDPLDLGVDIARLRVFAGYSGWAPGQLEGELDSGMWIVVEGTPDDVLTPDPESLWRVVLGRQRGQRAWLANFPPQPSLN